MWKWSCSTSVMHCSTKNPESESTIIGKPHSKVCNINASLNTNVGYVFIHSVRLINAIKYLINNQKQNASIGLYSAANIGNIQNLQNYLGICPQASSVLS